jgi:Flp pilus assembly pilin Flp
MNEEIRRFLTEECGQDVVEYSLMLVLIGAVVLIYITGMGVNLSNLLSKIGTRLEAVNNQIP